jgi:hypothetical protein
MPGSGEGMQTQKISSKKPSNKPKTITMNEDLKQWISAGEKANILKSLQVRSKDKKPKGKCSICRVHPAKFICIKCGDAVCSSCFFTMVGLCQNCLSKDTIEKWKNKKTDWKKILDVDWVD